MGDVAGEVFDAEGAAEATLHIGRALRRERDQLGHIRHGQEVVVRQAPGAGPAKVVGDEGRVEVIGEPAQRVEVGLVEGRVPEEVHPHAVKHDGVSGAHRVEACPRHRGGVEEVFADDLEVVHRGPVREEVRVMRRAQAEPECVARNRRGGHTARNPTP